MTQHPPAPDIWRTIAELDGGGVEALYRHAAIALAKSMRDLDTRTKGRLTMDLTFEHTKGSGQILVSSKVSCTRPTEKGKTSEEANAETLVYVHSNGHLSVIPDTQMNLDFKKERDPT